MFAQFGSDVDAVTRGALEAGDRLSETLKQNQHEPLRLSEQVLLLFAAMNGFLSGVPTAQVRAFNAALIRAVPKSCPALLRSIDETGELNQAQEADLRICIQRCLDERVGGA